MRYLPVGKSKDIPRVLQSYFHRIDMLKPGDHGTSLALVSRTCIHHVGKTPISWDQERICD